MTYSVSDRRQNLELAARLMSELIGARCVSRVALDPESVPLRDIYPTTWTWMLEEQWIKYTGWKGHQQYHATGYGWRRCITLTGSPTGFEADLVLLKRALQSFVKGRSPNAAFVGVEELATKSGLPEGWIANVLDSGALGIRFPNHTYSSLTAFSGGLEEV
jgi:hypothetical protein